LGGGEGEQTGNQTTHRHSNNIKDVRFTLALGKFDFRQRWILKYIANTIYYEFKKRLHEGQYAFVQLTVKDNLLRKCSCSFSLALNSAQLRIIVILWSVNKDQALGKEYNGIFS
jgi:hypothetical protein